jgi:hypothetical protein
MQDQLKWWAPVFEGDERPRRSMAIPWTASIPPTAQRYRDVLVDRLDELIKANPKQADGEMDTDSRCCPDLISIRSEHSMKYWAFHIGESAQMSFTLARIDWGRQTIKTAMNLEDDDIPRLSDYLDGLAMNPSNWE